MSVKHSNILVLLDNFCTMISANFFANVLNFTREGRFGYDLIKIHSIFSASVRFPQNFCYSGESNAELAVLRFRKRICAENNDCMKQTLCCRDSFNKSRQTSKLKNGCPSRLSCNASSKQSRWCGRCSKQDCVSSLHAPR